MIEGLNYYAFLSLPTMVVSLVLASILYANSHKSKVAKIFVYYLVFVFLWGFCEFQTRIATSMDVAFFWESVRNIIWAPALASFVHVAFLFSGLDKFFKNKIYLMYLIIYLPMFFVIAIEYFHINPNMEMVLRPWGWERSLKNDFLRLLTHIWVLVVSLFSIISMIIRVFYVDDVRERKEIIILFIGILMPVVLGVTTEVITVFFQVVIPRLTVVGFGLGAIFMTYAIWKYDAFVLTPEVAAKNVIDTMPSYMLLLDTKAKITQVNKALLNSLKYKKKELIGHSFELLFKKKESDFIMHKLSQGEMFHEHETYFRKTNRKYVDVLLSTSQIYEYGIFTGYVCMASDISQLKRIENKLINKSKELSQKVNELEVARFSLKKRQTDLSSMNEEVLKKNKDISKAKKRIERFNKELDEKVKKRTRDLEKANQKIKDLFDNKSKFINQVAHDLRTPLTPISILLPVAIKDIKKNNISKAMSKFKVMENNLNYLLDLIKSTLDVSRIDAGTVTFDFSDVSVNNMFKEVIKDNEVIFKQKKIKVKNIALKNLPFVKADKMRIHEVLNNLITNSIKYMSDKKQIILDAKIYRDKFILISVTDSGAGIDKKNIKRIFDEFYKVDQSRHEAAASAGLGLSICKRIIKMHKGKIWAESDGLGKGTTINFTLPIKKNSTSKK